MSGFDAEYPDHAGRNKQPFFFTTPKQRNNHVVLKYQQKFVEEMLRHSLPYPHVLYCIDNETSGEEAWAVYWADFIQERARKAGAPVSLTQMWDAWDLKTEEHRRTFDHPDRFGFVDISQNNHQKGQTHWDNFQWTRSYLAKQPRPINTVKTYGADTGRYGTDRDGLERWWRHLIGGAAGVRFHRPESGLGFNDKAEASIRAARLLESGVKFWDLAPALELLKDREANEAYAAAQPGRSLVIYFPDGGEVNADLRKFPAECEVRWLDIGAASWKHSAKVPGGAWATVKTPGQGQWAGLIQPAGAAK
jgi:hypothetical protein